MLFSLFSFSDNTSAHLLTETQKGCLTKLKDITNEQGSASKLYVIVKWFNSEWEVNYPVISNGHGGKAHPEEYNKNRELWKEEFHRQWDAQVRIYASHALTKEEGKQNEIQRNSAGKKNNKQKNISRQVISHPLKSTADLKNWQGGSDKKKEIITDLKELVKNVFAHFQERKDLDVVKSIKNNMPILWFGDILSYFDSRIRILTIGQNPSNNEFKEQRFKNIESIAGKNQLSDSEIDTYMIDLINYFYDNPYTCWFGKENGFNGFNKAFEPLRASYYGSREYTPVHIDLCSPIATDPTWSGLKDFQNKLLAKEIFDGIFNLLDPDIILCNFNFDYATEAEMFIPIEKIPFKVCSNKPRTNSIMVGSYNGKIIIRAKGPGGTPFARVCNTDYPVYKDFLYAAIREIPKLNQLFFNPIQ